MVSQAQLRFRVETLGADRIICPFLGNESATAFVDAASLGEDAKHAIAHRAAGTVLRR